MILAEQADVTLSVAGRVVARRIRAIEEYYRTLPRRILLIHGYNSSETQSGQAMRGFRASLAECFGPLLDETFTATWPGKGPTSALEYPWTIKYARAAGRTLFREIRTRYGAAGPGELVLVAHSLGCRVVLEALRRVARTGRPPGLQRLTVVLMAPAVPVEMVQATGTLAAALSVADDMKILHSRADLALSMPFRLGQTLAREGWFPEAVGLHGSPLESAKRQDLYPARHNHYWRSREAAVAVCRTMGVPVTAAALAGSLAIAPELPLAPAAISPELPIR